MKLRTCIITVATVVTLSACAGKPMQFRAVGDQTQLDYNQAKYICQQECQPRERGYFAMGSPGFVAGAAIGNAIGNAVEVHRARLLFIDCMAARGFALIEEP